MGSDSPDALNATLAPDIVASTPFLLELFDARVRTADGKVDTTLVAYLDEQSAPWWSYILRAPGMAVGGIKSLLGGNKEELPADSLAGGSIELSEEDAGKLKSLRQSVLADVDKKTAITTLTVTLQDPKVTATVADSVVSKLQQYITAYRTRKAKEDCRYLGTALPGASGGILRSPAAVCELCGCQQQRGVPEYPGRARTASERYVAGLSGLQPGSPAAAGGPGQGAGRKTCL